jgi:hypothetical protein
MQKTLTRFIFIIGSIIGILTIVVLVWAAARNLFPWPKGDSSASAWTWLDENGNGAYDVGEKPLGNVCVYTSASRKKPTYQQAEQACTNLNEFFTTDPMGNWPHPSDSGGGSNFFAGASCSDIWIVTVPPEGYEHTTPSAVKDCEGDFGFREIR